EEQREEPRGKPGGQGKHPRIEVPADLRRVVRAEGVRRSLESRRITELDGLSRGLEHPRLRLVQRMPAGPSVRVVETVVQGLFERLSPLSGARDTLLRRTLRG